MRAAAACVLFAATVARADLSLDATRAAPTPHTPFGPACDRALAAAQAQLTWRASNIDFHVRERHVIGAYRWSDMCGVWGNYSLELAPDLRAPQAWRWRERREAGDGSIHRRGSMRRGGIRATFILDADDISTVGDWFVDAFQPAVDVCLASASRQ